MEPYEIQQDETQGVPVIHVQGYFSEVTGRDLQNRIEGYVRSGKFAFVIDFEGCSVINSPGLGTLLDLSLKVVDDFKGRLLLTGLDRVKLSVLEMVGVTAVAQIVPNIEEGLIKALPV